MRLLIPGVVVTAVLTGCAGKLDYVRPSAPLRHDNSIVVDKPRDAVWNAMIPALGKQFFVINNLDKSSGLINISYSGDPQLYVDCGRVTSYVKNARGERTYDFAGATASQQYEVMNDAGLFLISRRMTLEGRMNLIFEEEGPQKTRITANTRYVLNREMQVQSMSSQIPQSRRDSISFNSGQPASFPAARDGRALECQPTGRFEADVLSLVK
jgi:hypothetical protein